MICVWLAALGAASHTRTTDLWKALMCADFFSKGGLLESEHWLPLLRK
jgi:hypothetical protein